MMPLSKMRWLPVIPILLEAAFANALTWSTHGPLGGTVTDVAFSPAAPRVVYASTTAGIFRSDDAGDTWRDLQLDGVTHVTVDPTSSDVAFATTQQHVYKTTNGGATWNDISAALPAGILPSALIIDPTNTSTIYLGSRCGPIGFKGAPDSLTGNPFQGAGVYKSTDGGATWSAKVNGLTDRSFGVCIEELALDPAAPQHLFASPVYSDGGYSQSFDGGATWTRAPGLVPSATIVVNPSLPNVRYGLNVVRGAFFASLDSGVTWQVIVPTGATSSGPFRSLAIDPANGRLFLGTDGGIFRSGDGGLNWLTAAAPPQPAFRIAVDPGAGFVFAGTATALLRMPLPLDAWSAVAMNDPSANVLRVAVDPNDASTVYAATQDYYSSVTFTPRGRTFVSHDRGASWQLLAETNVNSNSSLTVDGAHTLYIDVAVTADPRRAGYLYRTFLGFGPALQYSRDGGKTWTNVMVPTNGSAGFVAIDPSNTSTLYIASEPTSVAPPAIAKSTDSGVTWTPLYDGNASDPGHAELLAVAPASSKTLYRIGNSNAVCPFGESFYRSDDAGVTWTRFTWPDECRGSARALVVDPRDARSAWVVSGARRIVHSPDGGATWEVPDQPPGVINAIVFSADGATLHAAIAGHGVWEASIAGPHHRPAGR